MSSVEKALKNPTNRKNHQFWRQGERYLKKNENAVNFKTLFSIGNVEYVHFRT